MDAKRKEQHEQNKFAAALKGIDLDKDSKNENQRRLDEIQQRVNKRLYGEKAVEQAEYGEFGLEIEVEE